MKFEYWYTTVGLIGRSRTGKTYATLQLLAKAHKRASVLVPYPKQVQIYATYSDDIRVASDSEYNSQTVDNFIMNRTKKRIWCLAFDDLDYFVHNAKESRALETLPIASKGHWEHGNIWQSRRAMNLPPSLIQNSDYLIFTFGLDVHDYAILDKIGLDLDLYATVPEPVYDSKDPKRILSCKYLVLNTATNDQHIVGGFQ